MLSKKTILIILALMIAVIPSVSAPTFFDWLADEPSIIEDPLLCTAIDMWGCEIQPEAAIFGELYTHDLFTVTIPGINVWENLTGINQTGNFSVLEQGSPNNWAIEITRNGTYLVDYSISMQAPGGASEYDFGVSLNEAIPEDKTHSHRASTAGGAWGVISSSSILELREGDNIFLQVLDTDAPPRDIEIQSANFNVHELQTFQTTQLQTIIINQTIGGIVTDIWVNETGDTMTGDLNISAAASITETLSVNKHSAFGPSGNLFAIRVLDAAENINVDSSFNGVTSVLRQQVNNSAGREVLAFNYEVVCDNNITCRGNMAGYRGNTRNRGWAATMRGGYVTVFNERADHNITNAVGLFAVIATRLNNIRGMITTADAVRPHFTLENGSIGNATGFRMIDTSDLTSAGIGRIGNLWGIKIDDLNSDRLENSHTFDLGDDKNGSRIRANYTGDQQLTQTFLLVPEWLKVTPTLYVYSNGTININGNISVSSGDVVIWNNGTVEVAVTAAKPEMDFGDGSDGALVIDDSTTAQLSRDTYYTSITLTSNSNIDTKGFRLFSTGTVSIASGSSIFSNGGDALDGDPGGTGPGTQGLGGSVFTGAIDVAAWFANSAQGQIGGDGGDQATNGNAGTAGTSLGNSVFPNTVEAAGGVGGVGGAPGGAPVGGAAGAGGTTTELTAVNGGRYRNMNNIAWGKFMDIGVNAVAYFQNRAGSGSGGGGGGGIVILGTSGTGGGGGGSGGNGGVVYIAAPTISNSGAIEANGGIGGDGGAGGAGGPNGGGGGGGGGAGGGGGLVILIYNTYSGAGTKTASGGAGGTGGAGGAGGSGNGAAGANGDAGNAGLVLEYT